jgi:hypothetical protein
MHVAIGIGTLLLGGWVLNTPVQDLPPEQAEQIPEIQVPFSVPPVPAAAYDAGGYRRNPNPERAVPRDVTMRRLRGQKDPAARTDIIGEADRRAALKRGESPKVNPQATVQRQAAWILPPAPTDPLSANGPLGPQYPLPPTMRQADLAPSAGPVDPYTSPTAPRLLDVPPSRQAYAPRTAQSPSYHDQAGQARDQIQANVHPAYADQPTPPKAFADVRPFSGGVSPYMNLFRNDTAGGTIDNYSTFVRPALDQRSMNQQFNIDLFGLQRNQRIQNAALQQLGRAYSRSPQYIGTPQFYQNYGTYYPGSFGQGNNQGSYGAGYGGGGYAP